MNVVQAIFPQILLSTYTWDKIKSPLFSWRTYTPRALRIFVKDRFRSIQFVLFINEMQGKVSCFLPVYFGYTLTNEGSAHNEEIVEFFII